MKPEICSCCGQKIKQPRVIKVDRSMVQALVIAFNWCKEKDRHEFKMAEIRHLLSHTQYSKFNDWIRISSGMVYPGPEKWVYGFNMERIEAFLQGEGTVHDVIIDPITRDQTKGREFKIHEIRGLITLLNDSGIYTVEYKPRPI